MPGMTVIQVLEEQVGKYCVQSDIGCARFQHVFQLLLLRFYMLRTSLFSSSLPLLLSAVPEMKTVMPLNPAASGEATAQQPVAKKFKLDAEHWKQRRSSACPIAR